MTKADPHEGYREVVGVVSASVVCTGIWIGPGAVLTAAHCLCGSRKGALRVMVGAQTSYPELYFEVPEGSDHRITKIAQDGLLKDGDVALLLFDETKPVVACDVARPALPTPPRRASASNLSPVGLALGTEAVVVGFGLTGGDEDTRSEHVKFRAYLDEVDPGCTSLPHDGGSPLCAPKTELFARHRAGTRDTCYGDSGGPIYLRTASGELVLAGVTSRGLEGAGAARCVDGRAATSPAGAGRCGSGGIYTRVDGEVAAWIHRYVPSFRAD